MTKRIDGVVTPHPQSAARRPGTIAFIVTEDWFFASHFLPMVRAARAAGLDPIVVTRVRTHAGRIEAAGARVVSFEADRRSINPFGVVMAIMRLAAVLRRERVDRVHLIALRSIVVGGLAAMLAKVERRVFAVTGGGLLTARTDLVGRLATGCLGFLVRSVLTTRKTQYLFENADDPARFGLLATDSRVTIVGGAGVDPVYYSPTPLPAHPPIRVALVARMVWSKGVDLAVAAVEQARAGGAAIELSLFGAPDPANPKSIPEKTLRDWSRRDGISWHGAATDIPAVWKTHHVACLPSRGGEGLPRSLLEAAACGRGIVTTDVSGCRSFVRDGLDGIVVPANDCKALAQALTSLALHPARLASYGQSARRRVEDGYTEAAVIEVVTGLYRRWDR